MRIEIRSDSVEIDGYVNAVGRDSRPLRDRKTGQRFVEQIVPGAFKRALTKNEVSLLLNHEPDRVLGDTTNNLQLYEDSIGLRAHAIVTDAEVIKKAREGKLRGWSFGFYEKNSTEEDASAGLKRRYVEDLELKEVSIIDDRKIPCYEGTSLETRSEELIHHDVLETRADIYTMDKPEKPDYNTYRNRISALEKE